MAPPLHGRILVVDDDVRLADLLRRVLARAGHEVVAVGDPEEGLRLLRETAFDLLLTDLHMPGLDGLELLARARVARPSCEVVVMTGYATVSTAREALKRGALDYLTKPILPERDLEPLVQRVLAESASDEAETAAAPPIERGGGDGLVARSAVMQRLLERARRVARSGETVLLLGESGTGKEELAHLLHECSARAGRPLVRVNCAALPETLLESELFGHVRGAFTGAERSREGLFEAAHGGTLLLDEIGEMPPALQAKLLRVLQGGELRRLGEARRTVCVDVRVIAATNRDLEEAVRLGHFRKDLYYRLAVVPLRLPPLRERPEDIEPLVERFLERSAHGGGHRFSRHALEALRSYDWPGNVRELANAVAHALVLGEGIELELHDLPSAIQDHARKAARALSPAPAAGEETLEETEVRCILQALARTALNRTRAAALLGITRRTLGYRIRKLGLEAELDRLADAAKSEGAPLAKVPAATERRGQRSV